MDSRRDPERLSLASYPLSHPIPARFSDMDAVGHLNNVSIASFYEDARVALDARIYGQSAPTPFPGFTFVVAQVTVQYLAEASYPGTYLVGCGVSRIGTSSFVQSAGLFRDGVCYGLCDSVLVHLVDGVPAEIPPQRRALMETMWFPIRAGGLEAIPGQASGGRLVGTDTEVGRGR